MPNDPDAGGPGATGSTAGGREPAEGRPDLEIPGADRDEEVASEPIGGSPEERRRDELAGHAEPDEPPAGAEGAADVLPDVDVPDHQM